jgi:hypothetical protein
MKDHVDKSMGIVTHIAEVLSKIKPTHPLRLDEHEARKKRNCLDSSGNSGVRPILVYLTIMSCLYSDCFVQDPFRLRSTGGGHSVCERSVCTLSGTSITVISHCDIHHECVRRDLSSSPSGKMT